MITERKIRAVCRKLQAHCSSSMFHQRMSDFLSNINSASKLPMKAVDKTEERVPLSFFPHFLAFLMYFIVCDRKECREANLEMYSDKP